MTEALPQFSLIEGEHSVSLRFVPPVNADRFWGSMFSKLHIMGVEHPANPRLISKITVSDTFAADEQPKTKQVKESLIAQAQTLGYQSPEATQSQHPVTAEHL